MSESNPFVVLPLTKNGLRISHDIYREFERTYEQLEKIVPSGREFALVRTKLQEACNWAVEAVATRKEYQRVDHMADHAVPEGHVAQPQDEDPVGDLPLPEQTKEK